VYLYSFYFVLYLYFIEPCRMLFVLGTYTVLFFDGLVKILKPQCIKVMRPDLKKRVNISSQFLCRFLLPYLLFSVY